jgi:hypothetical protein
MSRKERAVIVPLDNRPVTYLLPQLVAAVAGLEPVSPPRQLMGSLSKPTDLNKLNGWLKKTLAEEKPTALIVSLDTFLYGGMVPWSRVSRDSLEDVLERVKAIAEWKRLSPEKLKVMAQASIMRIPDYDDASEEPEYWQQYGRKLFRWSHLQHQDKIGKLPSEAELKACQDEIPDAVREDFLWRRKRNFEVNRKVVDYAKSGDIDYLVFSQDDTGEFGLNVFEKTQLIDQAKKSKATNVVAYAGADEVLLSLMARFLASSMPKAPQVRLCFSPTKGAEIGSNYEGQTIGASLHHQIAAAGLGESEGEADFAVIVHTSGSKQGDHIWLPGHIDLRNLDTRDAVACTIKLMEETTVPIVLCDAAYSNGGDPLLVDQLLARRDLVNKLWAYSGWNTTGNAVGCALALGAARLFAQQNDRLAESKAALKRALFVRFADDWAYQTQVRGQLEQKADEEKMRRLMSGLLVRISRALDFEPGALQLTLPWQRTFEVEIGLPELAKC